MAMEIFRFLSLPQELQLKILNSLDSSSLARVCRTSKGTSAKAIPVLWRDINVEEEIEVQRQFLIACESLVLKRLQRWQELSAHVRSIRFGRILGISWPRGDDASNKENCLDWSMFTQRPEFNLYRVIGGFQNLEELSVFVKSPWDLIEGEGPDLAPGMKFPSLRKLRVGGCIMKDMLLALLSTPERIEELSCVALQGTCADQDAPPEPQLLLTSVQQGFSNLRILHLCKLGELYEGYEELPGSFDQDLDGALLKEWANFLPHVSTTLLELTLEDRFLISDHDVKWRDSYKIDPKEGEEGDPEYWGSTSSERFREIVLPTLQDQAWPNLCRLKLIGLNPIEDKSAKTDPLDCLRPRIQVTFEQGGLIGFNWDATPMEVCTPAELWSDT